MWAKGLAAAAAMFACVWCASFALAQQQALRDHPSCGEFRLKLADRQSDQAGLQALYQETPFRCPQTRASIEKALAALGAPGSARRAAATGAPGDPCTQATRDWALVRDSRDSAVLLNFRNRLPAACATLRDLADAQIRALPAQPQEPPRPALASVQPEQPRGRDGSAAARVAAEAGRPLSERVFRDCLECPEMVAVPGGSFVMGSPEEEVGRAADEGPQRRVSIQPVAIGKYEVTFEEWDACVAAGGCGGYRPGDRGWGRAARPVINVSWRDAQSYVQWLSRRTGKRYRLLTEAEWEYAARAGSATAFSFGETITSEQANFDATTAYGAGAAGRFRKRTSSAGSFSANAFGLHEMHGNVAEWVEDCYVDSYAGAPAAGAAVAAGDCATRVSRGGSWYDYPQEARSARRLSSTPLNRLSKLGFRVARSY